MWSYCRSLCIAVLLIAGHSSIKAQEKPLVFTKDTIVVPISIYQSNFVNKTPFSTFSLNNELLRTKMNFSYLYKYRMIDENYQVPLTFGKGSPTKYIYESYNDLYHRKDLQKSFFKLSSLYDLPRQKNPK